jgi:hypothetical protein
MLQVNFWDGRSARHLGQAMFRGVKAVLTLA